MGRVLTVRVMACTYDVNDVARRWPRLCRLAWPQRLKDDSPDGVLELVAALHDQVRFGDELSEPAKQALGPGVEHAAQLSRSLEQALADRDPQRADKITYEMEDSLDGLEKTAAKL
ncbi:MAG: hypothetical protein ACOCVM_04960 [Desulfovibrionaceae bacterium]